MAAVYPRMVEGRVLVVEDDVSIREVTALGLRSAGFRVDTAADGRQALVTWTLTQFPTVRQVRFSGGAPVGRADYPLLAPIVVTGPSVGDRVTAPLTVTGTADAFEATVSVRVLDADGRQVAAAFGAASCGSGCRGAYRVVVTWRTAREQHGTIEVYEVSARDGARINAVIVPVLLGPHGS
ncbi:Gmad2 immunoglobulin-like domain-containing protein [Micromonospora sp. NPDC049102]|uniref:Gmad2 immunoglobulin-like domain-containing protein n=1 Tax=Micromonospora sp. NPDC049102 TaxID=3364265 RepID=UPI003715D2B0